MTGGKRIMLELVQGCPCVLTGGGEYRFCPWRGQCAEIPVEGYAIPGVMMDDCCQENRSLYLPAGFLMNFPEGRLQRRFSFFEPSAGKLPQTAPDVVGQSLLDENVRTSTDNAAGHGDVDFFLLV